MQKHCFLYLPFPLDVIMVRGFVDNSLSTHLLEIVKDHFRDHLPCNWSKAINLVLSTVGQ